MDGSGARLRAGGPARARERRCSLAHPASAAEGRPGIRVHRRYGHDLPGRREVDNIPVTHPIATLVDLAAGLPDGQLEAAVNEADHLGLVSPERLRQAIDGLPPWPGAKRLRELLDGPTIVLAATELERLFLPLAYEAGLPPPQTQTWLDGYRVDFYWPDLGLVVEADSLRYHRTPFKQASDRRRDNAHAGSGLTTLRFTHSRSNTNPTTCERP